MDIDIGTTSATMRTITVLKRMAAQSGMIRWITKGSDYSTIALPTSKVTRNRW